MSISIRRLKRAVRDRLGVGDGKLSSFDAVLCHFLTAERSGTEAPLMIFDIGAHFGESVARFRRLFPEAVIHTFEPDSENFAALKENWAQDERVIPVNLGISSRKGTLLFHRNVKHNTSGFHPVNPDSQWLQDRSASFDVAPEEFTEKSYEVPITDLDSYAAENGITHIDFMKIDTQGHEDEVLAGAEGLLENGAVDVIETELTVGNPYTKSLQFYDLERVLIPAGFRFYAISRGGNLLEKPDLGFNVIYVHERLLG
jgi:FkbM family methyltransferase